jgi:metallo-beta-lactamase family protein
MKITFLGATRNVTGSRFLLETGRSRILVDCGLYREREYYARNWERFPVSPSGIDHVLLTHAHIDHSGYLPKFIREGFRGRVFCTAPTAEITAIALLDAAKVQEADVRTKRKRHRREKRKGPYPETPLYTTRDAERVFPRLKTHPYGREFKVAPGIQAVFHDAGHILGASMIEIKIEDRGKKKRFVFSGDIGRWNKPILGDPALLERADCVVMESTYGNRVHEDQDEAAGKLKEIIVQAVQRGGNVIIPTFAIGRAQELLYYLSGLFKKERIRNIPVYLDSPMAIRVTRVFRKYTDYFDSESRGLAGSGDSPFELPALKAVQSKEESKAINKTKRTAIIMAGAGMCTGGRIKHHLVHNIERPQSTILFVGYQAQGTLGRQILERPERVRIFGRMFRVKAAIAKINGFSAHADKNELVRWVSGFKKPPARIFVVHGESEASTHFADILKRSFKSDIIIPGYLESVDL